MVLLVSDEQMEQSAKFVFTSVRPPLLAQQSAILHMNQSRFELVGTFATISPQNLLKTQSIITFTPWVGVFFKLYSAQ